MLKSGAQTASARSRRPGSGLPTSVVKVSLTCCILPGASPRIIILARWCCAQGSGKYIGNLLGKQHDRTPLHSRMLRERMWPWQQQRDGWGLPPRKCGEIPLPNSAYVADGGSMGDPGMLSASSESVSTHTPKPTLWNYSWQDCKEIQESSPKTLFHLKVRGPKQKVVLKNFIYVPSLSLL